MEYKRQLPLVSRNTFPGYEDPLQRQPQERRPGLLSFLVCMNNYQYSEHEENYILFALFICI